MKILIQPKITTRSQEREAVAEVSGQFEVSATENNQTERYLAGRSKSPKSSRRHSTRLKRL